MLVATRTQIIEVSLVPIPSDPGACITRVFGGDMIDVQHRMILRHKRMPEDRERIKQHPPSDVGDDYDESSFRRQMPPRG